MTDFGEVPYSSASTFYTRKATAVDWLEAGCLLPFVRKSELLPPPNIVLINIASSYRSSILVYVQSDDRIERMAGKRRYVYETFFDCHPYWNERKENDGRENLDTVEYLVNHPTVRRIEANHSTSRLHFQPRFRQLTEQASTSLKSSPTLSSASSVSSLRTVFSLQVEQDSCVGRRSQSHNPLLLLHSASVHHSQLQSDQQALKFSLHLSPKLRSKFCEVLSPISDKSQEIGENESIFIKSTAPRLPLQDRKFRPKSLFSPPTSGNEGAAALNSSDSGISISAHSLLSHDTLPTISSKPAHLSLENSQEIFSAERESLPFLMPKLHRAKLPSSSLVSQPFQPSAGLSLTLPFPSKTVCQSLPVQSTIVDGDIPLISQSWYHGSITRHDAERRLQVTPEGTFLVRDSLATSQDYFLAARGENGFLHVQITSPDDFDAFGRTFQLATLRNKDFNSVAAIVNHCAKIGIYSPDHPPIVLKYPLPDISL